VCHVQTALRLRRSGPVIRRRRVRHGRCENARVHRLTYVLSVTLITAGLVVLGDAVATLLWQEPLSAAYGSLKQSQASDQLDDLEAEFPTADDLAAIEGVAGDEERARILAQRFRDRITEGDAIGRIDIDSIGLDAVLMQGTDTGTLQQGPGHYARTPLPGQGKTTGIAGHRTTYLAPFRHINDIEDGDSARIELPYGAFTYEVTKHDIVAPGDVEVIDPVGYDQVVLTACHPLYSAAQRYVIFAKLVRIDTFAPSGTGAWVAP
jgi:sortase A